MRAISAAVRGYSAHGLPQQAAAISFRVLFSFVPLVALIFSLLHVFMPADVADRFASWLIGELAGAPELEASVDRAVIGGRGTASVASVVALAALIWGASGVMGSIRFAFQAIWATAHRRPFIRGKLIDLALVLSVGIVAIVGFGLGIVAEAVAQLGGDLGDALGLTRSGDRLGEVIGIGASLALSVTGFLVLYLVVPPERPRWSALWPGALVGAIGFELATITYGWYLTQFSNLAVVYGSLGALLGFLLVVYVGVLAMLLGAEIVAANAEPPLDTEPQTES